MSAYEDAGSVIYAATKGMKAARQEFDDAMNRGDHRRAQDAANEMATFACALGQAAHELEIYFNDLRGMARADSLTASIIAIASGGRLP